MESVENATYGQIVKYLNRSFYILFCVCSEWFIHQIENVNTSEISRYSMLIAESNVCLTQQGIHYYFSFIINGRMCSNVSLAHHWFWLRTDIW